VEKTKKTGQGVALKLYGAEVFPLFRQETVKEEARILQLCTSHPNIVTFKEYIAIPEHAVIVLHLEEGELLPLIATLGGYSEEDAQNFVRQLLEAVDFLHSKNFVHRDISPENLLVRTKAEKALRLGGFSLATDCTDVVSFDGLVGTPALQPPELINRESFGKSVDVWSLGVITFALLSGKFPFTDDNVMRLNITIRKADIKIEANDFKGVSNEAKSFVQKCIVADPKARYTAAQAKADAWLKTPKKNALPSFAGNLKKTLETNAWNC